jgi:hypothetical protein
MTYLPRFNSASASGAFVGAGDALGPVLSDSQDFTVSGNFTVPDGVNLIYVTLIAAGGSGTFSGTNAGKGEDSTFGTLLTAKGGLGGGGNTQDKFKGGRGGGVGALTVNPDYSGGPNPFAADGAPAMVQPYFKSGQKVVGGWGGLRVAGAQGGCGIVTYKPWGGSNPFGGAPGLASVYGGGAAGYLDPTVLAGGSGFADRPSGYGAGGNAPTNSGADSKIAGGGAGEMLYKIPLAVTPGQVIAVGIGAGGLDTSADSTASATNALGAPGFCRVEW